MTRLSDVRSHISTMRELREIVGAMRSLAGMRVQESQRALPGIRRYAASMGAALGSALRLLPADVEEETRPDAHPGAIVLCMAEHGFVGGFNERVLEAAGMRPDVAGPVFVLGSRGAVLATGRGTRVDWTTPAATRLAGIPDVVDRVADALYARIARGGIPAVDVVFCRYRQGASASVERRRLLPIDMSALSSQPLREPPLHTLGARVLLEKLAAEYVVARLTEAAVESLASENAARFSAMDSAHRNVDRKLDSLHAGERQARQAEITAELLELIAGVEATRPGARRGAGSRAPAR